MVIASHRPTLSTKAQGERLVEGAAFVKVSGDILIDPLGPIHSRAGRAFKNVGTVFYDTNLHALGRSTHGAWKWQPIG